VTDKLYSKIISFCDVKAIKIIGTQMKVQNLRINLVFVLFTSDISIEDVSTYHKKCEDSAYLTRDKNPVEWLAKPTQNCPHLLSL
jgi:hypothetical protein